MGNLQSLGNIQLPLIGMEGSQHQFKEARLPCTVGPSDTNPIPSVQGKGGSLEENSWPSPEGQITRADHKVI